MSRLRVFAEHDPSTPTFESKDGDAMRERLAAAGVRFERWRTRPEVRAGDAPETVIAAYREEIDALMAEGGYQSVDVVSLDASHPDKAALRRKFLDEHTHSEDEVRFFVAGQGLFTLHIGAEVFEVLCQRGDLIRVPAGTPHWFDMSDSPNFIAIRVFGNPAGWVANFTGSDIASRFPRLD
jgi:1,2-dihydroxy-3-keto-5-methylthiopentene dioxygenase